MKIIVLLIGLVTLLATSGCFFPGPGGGGGGYHDHGEYRHHPEYRHYPEPAVEVRIHAP